MTPKLKYLLAVLVALLLIAGAWLVYDNYPTVPFSMQNHALETYSPEHSDGFSENHLGVHIIIAFTKNRVTIINDASIIDNPNLVKKTKFKKTATARAIYSAITGRTDFKKANTNLGKDLGHAFVSRSKNKIVLKNRKLTLTFTRAKDGNWVTPDGTIWFLHK